MQKSNNDGDSSATEGKLKIRGARKLAENSNG